MTKKQEEKYWYLTTFFECPVCGRQHKERQRVYTRKPEDLGMRWKFVVEYDHCLED